MKLDKNLALCSLAFLAMGSAYADDVKLELRGVGWTQLGRIEHSDTVINGGSNDWNKNWQQNTGGLISATAKIDENWQGAFGLGVVQAHLSRGAEVYANNWYPFWVTFVSEANFTYSHPLEGENHSLKLTVGAFPYNYNPDIKNLGWYLLRGYVYPGNLISGFETKHVIPAANQFGTLFRYQMGDLRNDIILNSETDEKPLYDFSLADIFQFDISDGLQIGAGINLYRLLAQNSKITSPGSDCQPKDLGAYVGATPQCYIIDTAGGKSDTVTGSLSGQKLMARFRLDPKILFGFEGSFGKEDLVLYSELAVLGLKNYPVYYNDIKRRIPVMVGFNLPAFGLLDYLSLEVEYYASKNYADNGTALAGSWVPRYEAAANNARDDWKWSLYASRVVFSHVKFSGQVANDHFRPGGFHDRSSGAEALTTPKDWYWMAKVAYFF